MGLQPLHELPLNDREVADSVPEESRAEHCYICASHDELHDIDRLVDATGRSEAGPDATAKDCDPA